MTDAVRRQPIPPEDPDYDRAQGSLMAFLERTVPEDAAVVTLFDRDSMLAEIDRTNLRYRIVVTLLDGRRFAADFEMGRTYEAHEWLWHALPVEGEC